MLSKLRQLDLFSRTKRKRRLARGRTAQNRVAKFEQLEDRNLLTAVPFGADTQDTGEFMLGEIAVNVVFLESNGTVDTSTEDWNPQQITDVKGKISEGLQWWEDTLDAQGSVHTLNFNLDFTHADTPFSTDYEPIARRSNDFTLWVNEFLSDVGFNTANSFSTDIRSYNHSQREAANADWGFTIFVVNDFNDSDHAFDISGSFLRAFSFSGGRFMVVPASRPASTIAHEAGHMFWARDQYPGAGSFTDHRGYFNTQNVDAANNPDPNFGVGPSIMANGTRLQDAFDNHTSSPSSLEMIGWRDSDNDGIFDILDVSHTLTGSGQFDPATGIYHFLGQSSVQTLPNLNSSGQQNDITLNKIRRAEYRVDGGIWQTAASFDAYQVDLNLTIGPLPLDFQTLEIRTLDTSNGITSPIFTGVAEALSSSLAPGVNGFVWNDADNNGVWSSGEGGLQGWTVQVVDLAGQPLELQEGIDPDDHFNGELLNFVNPDVILTAVGPGVADGTVIAKTLDSSSTGAMVFGHFLTNVQSVGDWDDDLRHLRIDFSSPVSAIRLDAVGGPIAGKGRLDLYDADDNIIARYTTGFLSFGEVETMSLNRPTADIAYAVARGHSNTTIRLDNLRFGPEAIAITDAQGYFSIPSLPPGEYTVEVVAQPNWTLTDPLAGSHTVDLLVGAAASNIDFGFQTDLTWQNAVFPEDVNNDGVVAPLDALLIINELNANGAHELPGEASPPPFIDVNGDGFVAPIDALLVINFLNQQAGTAFEPEASSSQSFAPSGLAEGENVGLAFQAPSGVNFFDGGGASLASYSQPHSGSEIDSLAHSDAIRHRLKTDHLPLLDSLNFADLRESVFADFRSIFASHQLEDLLNAPLNNPLAPKGSERIVSNSTDDQSRDHDHEHVPDRIQAGVAPISENHPAQTPRLERVLADIVDEIALAWLKPSQEALETETS